MSNRTLIVFDMDGVLVDVSRSYRETVRQTARLFFKGARGWEKLPNPLFQLSDLAAVKLAGKLNNDWDLSYTVIALLCSTMETALPPEDGDVWDRYHEALGSWDLAPMIRYLRAHKAPLSELYHGQKTQALDNLRVFYNCEVGTGNVIKQIFQEIYLGTDLFQKEYGREPRVYHGKGYILEETLLIDESTLAKLAESNDLAIATGRPRSEARYVLERFGIAGYFKRVMTLDDCLAEEKRILRQRDKVIRLSKPHPFMLQKIAERGHYTNRYYIGDMPDDMQAAIKAGFTGIGYLSSAFDKVEQRTVLQSAGARFITENVSELEQILASSRNKPISMSAHETPES